MGDNKKAFDSARSAVYVMDPIKDVAIAGALNKELGLPKEELGDNDFECDETDALYDQRLAEPLDEEFIANIDMYGVMSPIKIAKRDGLAVVVFGRRRLRAARVVNRRRTKRGEPHLTIKCDIVRGDDVLLMGNMIAENEARRDDSALAMLNKVKRMQARGVPIEAIAITCNRTVQTLEGLLRYDDNAITPLKKAVENGKMTLSTAAVIAKVKDPEKQKEAMEKALASAPSTGKVTASKAKQAAKSVTKKPNGKEHELNDKRSLKKLLEYVTKMDHGRHGDKTLAFWEGVENTLLMFLGTDKLDDRLVDALSKFETETEQAA